VGRFGVLRPCMVRYWVGRTGAFYSHNGSEGFSINMVIIRGRGLGGRRDLQIKKWGGGLVWGRGWGGGCWGGGGLFVCLTWVPPATQGQKGIKSLGAVGCCAVFSIFAWGLPRCRKRDGGLMGEGDLRGRVVLSGGCFSGWVFCGTLFQKVWGGL
jgi:hypothetical protein